MNDKDTTREKKKRKKNPICDKITSKLIEITRFKCHLPRKLFHIKNCLYFQTNYHEF